MWRRSQTCSTGLTRSPAIGAATPTPTPSSRQPVGFLSASGPTMIRMLSLTSYQCTSSSAPTGANPPVRQLRSDLCRPRGSSCGFAPRATTACAWAIRSFDRSPISIGFVRPTTSAPIARISVLAAALANGGGTALPTCRWPCQFVVWNRNQSGNECRRAASRAVVTRGSNG